MSDKKFQKKLEKIKKQGERYKQEAELREIYAEYVPERKKRKVSNIMLTISIIAIVAYVVANFALQYYTGASIDSSITVAWFSFFTVEIVSLAGIKVSKVRNSYDDDESYG